MPYLPRFLAFLCLAALGDRCFSEADSPSECSFLYQWTPEIARAVQDSATSPCLASRNLAIIYTSAFDAANATDLEYEPYLRDLERPVGEIDPETASLAALSFSAETFFPSSAASFRSLNEEQMRFLQDTLSHDVWKRSIEYGEHVATRLINERADDGSTSTQTYVPKDELGIWRRTPPRYRPPEVSYWGNTRPFAIKSAADYRRPEPLELASEAYAKEFELVRTFGSKESSVRTAEQTEIAVFWSCFSYTSTPAGHWYEIATALAEKEQLSYIESARLMAIINIAMADAGIACWDTKFAYESWRPVHAVRQADQDGNSLTRADPEWTPLLETPPHPDYISGHGAFSGAGGRIMELFLNAEDGYAFSTTSSSLPGVTRHYKSFDECVEEICVSRLYGGIHFQYSNTRGRDMGEEIADYVFTNFLRPRG